jgi:hypothetical protein
MSYYDLPALGKAQALSLFGFSVIPVPHRQKKPTLKWKAYQERKPTSEELVEWFGNGHGEQNIAIITGVVSGVVVVDADSPEAEAWVEQNLPATPWKVKTKKGTHHFYRHPGGHIRNKARIKTTEGKIPLDVRADGGFVIAAGSTHPEDIVYQFVGNWKIPREEIPVLDAYLFADPELEKQTVPAMTDITARVRAYLAKTPPAIEGQGGDAHTLSTACRIVRGFALDEETSVSLLLEWNQTCQPPWSEHEIRQKVRNAIEYGSEPIGHLRDAERPRSYSGPAPAADLSQDNQPETATGITVDDFRAYMPMHAYIFVPGRDLWPAASVNAKVAPIDETKASLWLDRNRTVEQMTWAPGEPMLIRNRLISEGGWIERQGVTCFNLYRPPKVIKGDPAKVTPWLEHIRKIYGQDTEHIVAWLAHRVQKPKEKINHALVLGGLQGIGDGRQLH